jgi:hypothetical protein
MSTKNRNKRIFLRSRMRSVRCEPTLYAIWDSRRLINLQASIVCYGDNFIFLIFSNILVFLAASFLLTFRPTTYKHSSRRHSCYMVYLSQSPWLDSIYNCRRVNVMKFLVMQCDFQKYHEVKMARARSTNGEKRNACRLLVGKPEGKRPLRRPRYR